MRSSTLADGSTTARPPLPHLQRVRQGVQPDGRLDLKLLRLAVHGWWLGNPLVYKPGTADLAAVAQELAGAGARSGTLVLDDRPYDGGVPTGARATPAGCTPPSRVCAVTAGRPHPFSAAPLTELPLTDGRPGLHAAWY